MNRKKLTSDEIKRIREKVKSGKVKFSVAKERGISEKLVYYYTKDFPSSKPGNSSIRGKTLDLLKQLLNQGYVDSSRNCSRNFRILRKNFPEIQRVQIDNKSIYFLEHKNKIALKAMIERQKSKVISYHDLVRMTQVFNIKLSTIEKNELRGKKNKNHLPIIRKKEGGYMSSYKNCQRSLDDFIGNNVLLGNFTNKNNRKKTISENDSLLKNDDSLVDFYIRMY